MYFAPHTSAFTGMWNKQPAFHAIFCSTEADILYKVEQIAVLQFFYKDAAVFADGKDMTAAFPECFLDG